MSNDEYVVPIDLRRYRTDYNNASVAAVSFTTRTSHDEKDASKRLCLFHHASASAR
jgi:hypothetical protein